MSPVVFDLKEKASVLYDPGFIQETEADRLYQRLIFHTDWKLRSSSNEVNGARLLAWYSENKQNFSYSGMRFKAVPLSKDLDAIREKVNDSYRYKFNSVLLNYYRTGKDSVEWHTENNAVFGKNPTIASISLGQPRPFILRHNKSGETRTITLGHGSLMLIYGSVQKRWKYSIPKDDTAKGRINLTFRYIY